ncbi:hypothetical protein [Yinghuangia soli]|uniref:Uncharacterized protein n=1 Tax=Yinghuangia soli TaxID=2908204 RepID=A0AA41PW16_9ACTN|nr:hypothetical protein [Yinghuangia soli]MCF2526751.1 hypothetical protein [Yinghuangia soli]
MSYMEQPDSPLIPGLKLTTRIIAARITQLEKEIVTNVRAGDEQQGFYAAHTAAYLRKFLAEFIGPTWHAWAQTPGGEVTDGRDPGRGIDGR